MRKPNWKRAEREAQELLRKYGYTKPPVDPEQIAEDEGLKVIYAAFESPYDDKVSGFFDLKERSIVVNQDISDNRITFTIAHELSHYVLHRDYIMSNKYIPMPRNNEYDGEKPAEEKEADAFAAELLVPLQMLKRYSHVDLNDLAQIFFVSRDVITYRLAALEKMWRYL